MKVHTSHSDSAEVRPPTPPPLIEVDYAEVGEIVRIDVRNGDKIGRFWIDLRIVNNCPVLTIATKSGKDRSTDRNIEIRGSFNIPIV